MVAPVGRRPVQTPPKTEKTETPPTQQPAVSTEGAELVDLLKKLGKQLETAWTQANKEPGGDPVVKFLRAFTGGDATTAAVQQENQTKLSERQTKAKDAMGFTVTEPEAPKKAETPATTPEPAVEGAVVPDASFTETRARILDAKSDFQATKAEAGALLYSLSKELKLAKEAGQTPEQITATVQQLLGEFRNGVALAPDLVAIGDTLGAQVAMIGLTGDSPAAYEALALKLLGGKPPPPAKAPPPQEQMPTIAEAIAAFEARGGKMDGGGGIPVGEFTVGGQPAFPEGGGAIPPGTVKEAGIQTGEKRTATVTTPDPKTETRRQEAERRRREQERRTDNDGGGGGQRIVEDQLNRQNIEREQQNRRIEEEQIERNRNRG